MALTPEDKDWFMSQIKPIQEDLEEHKAGVIELRKYVKNNDAISATRTMQNFVWFAGIALAVMTFLFGLNFDMFKDIWKILN